MRQTVTFVPTAEPIEGPVTKLGGRPQWREEPQWPVSRTLGRPMFFLGQFRLEDGPDGEPRMAYLFMTDSAALEIMDNEAAFENVDEAAEDLPDVDTFEPEGGENAVIIQPGGRVPDFVTVRPGDEPAMSFLADHRPVDSTVADDKVPFQFLGDDPVWLQFDETPGEGWRLVAQLTDELGFNFGDAGVGYVFVSPDGSEGRFLWQCH